MPEEPPKTATPSDPNPEKSDWIESLAQRSAGIPGASPPKPETPVERSPWSYAGMGFQLVGTTLLLAAIGYELDKYNTWMSPWGLLTCTVIGMVGGMYLLIKEALRINK